MMSELACERARQLCDATMNVQCCGVAAALEEVLTSDSLIVMSDPWAQATAEDCDARGAVRECHVRERGKTQQCVCMNVGPTDARLHTHKYASHISR